MGNGSDDYGMRDGSSRRPALRGSVDVRRQAILAGAWRVADLLEMNHRSPAMLDALCRIHGASREVIGGNLARRVLDRNGLVRLEASVTRQASEARDLQQKLTSVRASEALQQELADLLDFYGDALREIARKLGSA